MKKLLLMFASIVLIITFLPISVSAADKFPLRLKTSDKSGDGWTWVAESKTLTLSGVDWYSASGVIILADLPGDTQIILSEGSTNHIQNDSSGYAIYCDGDLSISGGGSLTIVSGGSGISAKGLLTINMSGTLDINTDQYVAISGSDGVIMINCSNIIVNCGNFCILSSAPVNITDSKVQLSGSSGIMVFSKGSTNGSERSGGGDVNITRSTVEIEVIWTNDFSVAIFASNPTSDAEIILDGCAIISSDEPILEPISLYDGTTLPESVLIRPVFEVDFDVNEGVSKQEDTQFIYPENELVSISSFDCVRTGYRLISWNTSKDGTGKDYAPNDTFNITEDVALYAQWTKTYAVTFLDWDGTVIETQVVLTGDSATPPSVELRDKYQFIGWDVPYTNVTTHLAVTAIYEKLPEPKNKSFEISENVLVVGGISVVLIAAVIGSICIISRSRKKGQK
jgi:hypothetical protein